MSYQSHLSQLHFALGRPEAKASIRQFLEDFRVIEELSFTPSGNGQHVYLFIEKQDLNTEIIAKQLARFANVRQVSIGYAGLKDRYAITRQWFSVDLAGKDEPDWTGFNTENIQVIESIRHSRKLKRGAIRHNHFQIIVRDFSGDRHDLEKRLEFIRQKGVPNYFGEQRFGHNDHNLKQFEKLAAAEIKKVSRHLRGLYLSAARSCLFNLVLSQRVEDQTWNTAVDGDVFMLEGSHSVFTGGEMDEEIMQRVNSCDIHPTGPMWGSGVPMTTGEALAIEENSLKRHRSWCEFLEHVGLKQERRALRVMVGDLRWEWVGEDLVLEFKLPTGSYATAVLRELVLYG